jgi:hypothetical protein
MNREGRAEIMKPRLPAVCGGSSNSGSLPQTHESGLDLPKPNRHASPGRKEAGGLFLRRENLLTLLSVAGKRGGQACSDGEQPRLEELRVPD